ncbi:MAG: efflux RND transporter periplasmic adaptor subunit, partial [Deltaproteobacteria bacterium]|nr:efflux RND transporter periplasmic adaptor subunit [Deltaproteobacteria bacterium]
MGWQGRVIELYYASILRALVFGAALLLLSGCKDQQKVEAAPTQTVEVVDVLQKDVPVYSEWIASTDGLVNATIRAQVQGYLIKQNYREGDLVKKGQVLFEIDPRSLQAAVDHAKAALVQAKAEREKVKAAIEQSKAEVVRMQAGYTTAKANLDRVRPLAQVNAAEQSGQASVAAVQASVLAVQASIEASEALILASQAAVDKAELDLSFTKIISPVDGIAGIAKAQIGNLVGSGSVEELTTVSTVDPIKIYIPVGEQEYLKTFGNGQNRTREIPLDLILADGRVHPHKGRFAFADRQVDVRTGTIKVAALFANPGNILRPGQYARVRAQTMIKKGALLVPQRAVTELQGSYQVAVVGPDNKIDIRPVKVAERIATLWVIDGAIHPGEKVVAEGVQRG